MDIKSEVKKLVVYAKCQQEAETIGNVRAVEYYGKFVRQSLNAIDRWADMAEAAIAHAEFQVSSHSRNGDDAPMDGATYIRERGKLWDAYMEARAKAKAITQQ